MAPARAHPDVLDELAALGPFFAVEAHRPGAVPAQPWRALADMTTASVLRDRIGVVSSALSGRAGSVPEDVELRVAASVTQLGVVARLVAPVLAAQASGHRLGLRLADTWWQDTVGGPVPLSVVAPAAVTGTDPGDPPEAVLSSSAAALLDEVIAPITVATTAVAPVSPRVLWGNVASAVNGAAGQVARARTELAPAAWDAAVVFFRHPALGAERDPPGPSFRRSSCCLIYRLAPGQPGAVCGDCVLGGR